MEKDLVKYVRNHTFLVAALIIGAFLLLAFGEYFLYRKTQELNRMVSEGVMQIKEEINEEPESLDKLMMQEEDQKIR